MREVWARIEAVLRAAAPDRFAALATGVTPEIISTAEALLGITLPPDVRESYAVHDGSSGVDIVPYEIYGLIAVPLHSLAEIVREMANVAGMAPRRNRPPPRCPEGSGQSGQV